MKRLLILITTLGVLFSYSQRALLSKTRQGKTTNIQQKEPTDAAAQNNLGYAYYKGQGVKRSYEKAMFWLRKSCDNGLYEACEALEKIQ